LFLFSQYDDSTPTAIAARRSRADGAHVRLLVNAQHLGLVTTDICRGELTDLAAFSPELFREIEGFSRAQ
jgi:hypothetical protein